MGTAVDDLAAILGSAGPGGAPPPAPATAPATSTAVDDLNAALAGTAPPQKPPESWADWYNDLSRNVGTGIIKGYSTLAGTPNSMARLAIAGAPAINRVADVLQAAPYGGPLADILRSVPGVAPTIAKHTYSPEEIESGIYGGINKAATDPAGILGPPGQADTSGEKTAAPYQPTSLPGKLVQGGIANAIPALVGGPEGAAARVLAGTTGGVTSEAYKALDPNNPTGQLIAGLLGTVAGGVAPTAAGYGWRNAQGLLNPESTRPAAEQTIAGDISRAARQPGSQLAQTIDTNLPQWTPGTRPDLGNVTESPGIRSMVYEDITRAKKQADATYEDMASATNQAQRAAVAAATPSDAAAKLDQLTAERDAAVAAMPAGITTKQEAGEQLRSNLQAVYDQRAATRQEGGGLYDSLEGNETPVNLGWLRDYARTQAASNAGDYGAGYATALRQLQSATGISPGTASFANSARQALSAAATQAGRSGDTMGQKAILDVFGRLKDHLDQTIPEIGQAADVWRLNSEPLDVFQSKPFASALKQDNFGRYYDMSNDGVANAFLTSPGASDALDRLDTIFGDRETATRGLQDYIAGQVRSRALNDDGSVNLSKLNTVLNPYQSALMRFPTLQRQFSTAEGAQNALNQQQAYQKLYSTVEDQLGLQKQDAARDPMYSANKFNKFVTDNSDLIDQAYTPEQAAVVRRVNDELQNMAQTIQQGKAQGTSGTAQLLLDTVKSHGSAVGAMVGTGAGVLANHLLGGILPPGLSEVGGAGLGTLLGNATTRRQAIFDSVRRQALTDPAYARSLLTQFDPSGVNTPTMARAAQYVQQRTPWLSLGGAVAAQQPQ